MMLMKLVITKIRKVDLSCFVLFLLLLLQNSQLLAQSIPINASIISNQNEVDLATNATDNNLSTKADVRASTGVLLGIGAYSGFLELQFPTTLPANTTSYVKIDTDDNILPALLGGSLGGLLSNVLGAVLIGNQEFTVQAKNVNTVVLEGNSQIANSFANNSLRIVVNSQNEYFMALTPSLPYNRIRLINRVGSLLGLGNVKKLGVYGAFYVETPDACGSASYTSFDGSGLNLDSLGLGGAGVTNPHHVIDSDVNNFSQLSLGVIAVAGSINQTVYFDGLSQASDQFLIRLKVDPSLLALGVANNIQIVGYNNLTVVQSTNLNSLLNLDLLTLLQGNQIATIPFAPNAPVNRIMVQYNSLLNVQLTQSLDLYDIKRVPPPPTISDAFTLNPVICSGATASLVAETITDTVINWYSQPVGGVLLATTNSGQPFLTGILTENTTFYAAAKRATCPEESLRIRIDVEVTDVPVANDILIASNVDACNGFVVLSPSSTIGGAVFRYYKDQLKTQEITTGYSGDAGITYAVNSTTGQLTISGLTAVGSPYNYYISLTVNGCENVINTLKQVVVTYSSELTLNVSSTIQGCGSVNLADAILNFDTSSDIQYQFFDSSNNPITLDAATNITTSGIYSIQSLSLLGGCSSIVVQVNAVVNPIPTLTIPNSNLVVDLGNSATLNATSNSPITWYDSNGNALPSNSAGPFSATGTYAFTAVANNGFCTSIGTIFVTVVDTANCPTITQRVYADTQSWSSILTGGVFDQNNAIDDNPQTFSTIVTGIGLLGVGTTWQTLQWNTTVAAGTPLNVKLGSQYSGLIVAGAYSIVGTKRNSSGVPIDIGAIQPVSGTLLNLLPGENSFEFTFVPSDNTGPKDYDGVRIIVGSIASVAQNIKVYEAYYDAPITQANCALGDVEDVFSGAVDLGIGVATVTVGVDNPYDAVDASLTSYATMYSGAGILAAADLTVSFTTPTLIGESIQIIMSRPSTILDLNLLTGFSIQMYLGNTPVGSILNNSSTLLSLTLLNGGSEAMVTIAPQTMVYDRIKIRFGGVAGVLDFLRVHDINRIANTDVIDADATNTIEVCAGETIQLEVVPQDCVNFIWYDAEVGGNIVSTGTSFTIPSTLAPGTYDFYIQPVRYGCETFTRGKVTVVVGQTTPINGITQVQINGNSITNICSSTGNVTLLAQLNSTLTLTNPIFYWYSLNGTTQQLIAGQSTSSLVLTGLAPGIYTYFVGVSSDEFCQTAQGDRTQVTFTILPFSQPSDIVADDVLICSAVDAIVIPTSSLTNPQFFWFFANDASQPIVSGSTVGGITYTIASNGTLTVSGLTISGGPYTYYIGMTSDASCLNVDGNFKPVEISVGSGTTPTTNDSTQTFCQSANPTIADIQVNEPNVTWYNSQTSTTALASTDALVNGAIYYGSITDAFGCVSSVRLEVTVSISNGTTPTTTSSNQTFCQSTNPTIADIQVNEPNVTWYNSQTSTTALASTDTLVNGTIYYGSITDAFGCVSSVRLEVTVSISNGTTPTTTASTQTFCQSASPTIDDIQVNEPNVTWYNSQTSTTPLASTDALVNGAIYYGSITDAFGCVSSTRLEITISISNGTTPTTTASTQTFCQSANPTIADIQVNEPNVTWYNSQTSTTALASTTVLVEGAIYYASIIDGFGCESSIRLEVTIDFTDEAAATITGGSTEECSLNEVTYTATTGMTNYIWTVTNGTITSGGLTTDNFVTVSWTTIGAASVGVTFDNNCGLPSSATLNLNVVVCSDLTITKTVDNATPSIDDNVTFTITVNNVGSSQLSDIVVNELLQSGYQFVSATPSVGTYNNLTGVWTIPIINSNEGATLIVIAKVLPTGDYSNTATIITSNPIDSDVTNNSVEITTDPICLLVYNEFSPNNDGANEFFTIDCIENYPNSKLEVFNRYGVLVYTRNKYLNDWDGTANVSGTVNKDDKLPTGTYYYILDLGENDVKKNGWLSIVR